MSKRSMLLISGIKDEGASTLYTMEYYSVARNNGILKFADKWVELGKTIPDYHPLNKLSFVTHRHKDLTRNLKL